MNRISTNRIALPSIVISTLAITLFLAVPAPAAPKFRPAKRQAPQHAASLRSVDQFSRTGNLQGCAQDLAIPLTLLVPEHIAQTVADRPSLFWYLAGKKDLSVAFYEVPAKGEKQLLWRKSVKVEQPGIVQLTFPRDQPELAIGKVYSWSVELVCDHNAIKPNLAQAALERVAPSQWLEAQLTKAETDQRRAELYATSGQWYDAVSVTAAAMAVAPDDQSIRQDLFSLMEQIGLKNIADRER